MAAKGDAKGGSEERSPSPRPSPTEPVWPSRGGIFFPRIPRFSLFSFLLLRFGVSKKAGQMHHAMPHPQEFKRPCAFFDAVEDQVARKVLQEKGANPRDGKIIADAAQLRKLADQRDGLLQGRFPTSGDFLPGLGEQIIRAVLDVRQTKRTLAEFHAAQLETAAGVRPSPVPSPVAARGNVKRCLANWRAFPKTDSAATGHG